MLARSTGTRGISTIIFDWDGTLIDTATAGFVAFEKCFRDIGVEFNRAIFDRVYSPNWYLMYESMNVPGELWKTADDLWLQHYGEEPAKLVNRAADTIHELNRRGYKLGVVTSGSVSRVTREIREVGFDALFLSVLCNEHVEHKKPHPEALEKAISALESKREDCCYVGDAPEDIEMGRNASVMTVGVPSAYPSSAKLHLAQPDVHLTAIDDLLSIL